jgi:hypothetical protein
MNSSLQWLFIVALSTTMMHAMIQKEEETKSESPTLKELATRFKTTLRNSREFLNSMEFFNKDTTTSIKTEEEVPSKDVTTDIKTEEEVLTQLATFLNIKPSKIKEILSKEKYSKKKISLDAKRDLKAIVNTRLSDKQKGTLLLEAIKKGNEHLLANLLAFGADPSIGDVNGNTPVHFAMNQAKVQFILPLLIRTYQADINSKNIAGKTPLHLIMESTSTTNQDARRELATLFVQHGAKMDIEDVQHRTVLDNVVRGLGAPIDTVKTLLELGAPISEKTLDLAKESESIHKLLLAAQQERKTQTQS